MARKQEERNQHIRNIHNTARRKARQLRKFETEEVLDELHGQFHATKDESTRHAALMLRVAVLADAIEHRKKMPKVVKKATSRARKAAAAQPAEPEKIDNTEILDAEILDDPLTSLEETSPSGPSKDATVHVETAGSPRVD